MFRHCIGSVRIRVWKCDALERRNRYGRAISRSRAELQLRAATTTASCFLRSASANSRRRLLWPGLRLLWAGVWILRGTPVSRPTRELALAPQSLALRRNSRRGAALRRPDIARDALPLRCSLPHRCLAFCFDFRKSRLLELFIQRGKIRFQ
jgi:hypothetical protein